MQNTIVRTNQPIPTDLKVALFCSRTTWEKLNGAHDFIWLKRTRTIFKVFIHWEFMQVLYQKVFIKRSHGMTFSL